MPVLPRLASLWRTLFGKAALERDLDDELRAAVDTLAARHVASGMDPLAARRAALVALGGVEQVKEQVRAGRIGSGLETLAMDVRYAWRGLLRSPGFALVALLTLGVGVGGTTAIFSIVHAMLVQSLPYRDADRLIFIWSDMTEAGYPRAPLSGPELDDLRRRSTTCEAFGAIWANTTALTGEGNPEQLRIGLVTDDFFAVLGAEPALGRTFRPEDARRGAPPTILLGWPLFQRRYNADPSLVGRQILVNDRATTVIGVMPREFRLLLPQDSSVPDNLQAWQPFPENLVHAPRGQQFLRVVGRMRHGVTLGAAREDVSAIASRISREFSEYGAAGRQFTTVALHQDAVREVRPALLALFAGVGILLLIACVNVASLLIARAAGRAKETALRLALGAGRGRLIRQYLTEGLLLAGAGAVVGLLIGWLGLRFLIWLRPDALSRIELSRINVPVVMFTTVTAFLWGLLFSLAPLVEVRHVDLLTALQRQGRGTGMSVRYRTRATLVAVQIALSVVLLVSAGLLLRTFLHVQRVDPGFRADQALTFRVAVPFQRYRPPAAFNTFSSELQRKLAAIPGVTGVGAISHVPYDDLPNWGTSYLSDVSPNDAGAPQADARAITPGLFEALGVQLVEGRFFTDEDQDPAHPVAIVDDKLAGRMWPSRSALGQRLAVDPLSTGIPNVKVTVVGVVRHLRVRSLVADLTEQIFFSERFVLRNPMAYIVRVSGDPAARSADVRQAIAGLDPRLPIYDVRPFDSYVAGARATRRFTLQLAGAFAAAALLLACVGVYGVLAYAVTRRRHEFGVRRALGADGSRIIGEVMAEGLRVAGIGCAAGIAVAVVTSQLLGAQLYGVAPRDPVTFLGAGLLLAASSAIACWIPARRATAVSPMDALRTE